MVADLPAPGRPVMTTFGLDVSPVASHASGWQQNDAAGEAVHPDVGPGRREGAAVQPRVQALHLGR